MKALRKKYRKGGLVGKQQKLDKNKDGEITGQDFKMMKDGGRVKELLAGLETLPTKSAGGAKKKLPKTVSEIPGYDFKGMSDEFKKNLNKILSDANKAMEKATGLKKGSKGMKVKKYNDGGKMSKGKRPKKMKKMSGKDRKTVGNPASNKFVKKFSEIGRGSVADMELRYRGKSAAGFLKAAQKAQGVPNKALAKKTEDFGEGYGKRTYYEGNPGGLKGQTKGKGGNVGAGMKAKKKRKK